MDIGKHIYARSAAIRRAKTAVEQAGSVVRVIKFYTDGTFDLLLADNDDTTLSDFDRLDAAGLL